MKTIPIKINKVFKEPETIKNGLMFVKRLSRDLGALFCMPETKIHSFWMKNTFVGLDMIFLDENFNIVGFVENAIPHDLSSHRVNHPSRYVIEISAGFVKKRDIKVGDVVKPIYLKKGTTGKRHGTRSQTRKCKRNITVTRARRRTHKHF